MDQLTGKFGKAICVLLYAAFAFLAAKKKPLPLLVLFALHAGEYFLVGRKVAEVNGISQAEAAANCVAFGFTWWKPIRDGRN